MHSRRDASQLRAVERRRTKQTRSNVQNATLKKQPAEVAEHEMLVTLQTYRAD